MSDKSRRYLPSLDGTRGISAVAVLACHYGYARMGWIALDYFFVLSGYLITSILLSETNRSLGQYAARFYWRRILRTFPPYFGFLLLCGALYVWLGQPMLSRRSLLSLVTYWYNFEILFDFPTSGYAFLHLWSMSVEEQFYLLWPLLVFALSGANLRRVVIAVIVLTPLARLALFAHWHSQGMTDINVARTLYFSTPLRIDAFAMGAAIAVFRLRERVVRLRWVLFAAGCALAVGLLNGRMGTDSFAAFEHTGEMARFLSGVSLGYPEFMLPNRQFLWGYTVIDALSALFLVSATQRNVLQRFLATRFLCYLGRISYGFYIFHWPILFLLLPFLPDDPWSATGILSFFLVGAATVGVAHLSYFYFERRFLDLKDRFAKRDIGLVADSNPMSPPPA